MSVDSTILNISQGDNIWDANKFRENLEINISKVGERETNLDLINVDTSIANALRRIMISEVPSVAAEYIYILNNTSVIQDEVIAQRIGLIPLKVDPDRLTWLNNDLPEDEKFTDENTIVLSLNVKCTRNLDAPKDCTDPSILYHNAHIYARDLKFEPQGKQEETFADSPVVSADPDILIAKLRPGQEISLRAHCILGIGADHAKFSPVCTASYRLMPKIIITEKIKGESAKRFQKCFPPGVIDINENDEAYVKDARKDTMTREVLRHEEFQDKVKLDRVRNHFIFNIETVGAMSAEEIFLKSVKILKNKAEYLKNSPISQ
ncbi:hypothetical protein Kpol_473p3 [Vanderwaltozyma polyspora DSM 70294]|uniref:DNA-directed RNA polymerases I and III subunit RPAC1 n=1 Tax=Vanderwaltozyma polyspora (strain ATCC 22028 / DSM 70294 / BCRC 21397 / CBS 2163 / NBRC 10782 / NRRL Y-8283 / UCD 57-17) TaxID=436907 RepID=A7TPZ5_VANPO|nr:uncharacterized protein Kpol_473p3 [Vanderwaltozyma polyspora DSM 70294]EDO15644.1 hypothetical protein Kpol_473p3 [Vanderwaltozyma polyspora DSM 70294]